MQPALPECRHRVRQRLTDQLVRKSPGHVLASRRPLQQSRLLGLVERRHQMLFVDIGDGFEQFQLEIAADDGSELSARSVSRARPAVTVVRGQGGSNRGGRCPKAGGWPSICCARRTALRPSGGETAPRRKTGCRRSDRETSARSWREERRARARRADHRTSPSVSGRSVIARACPWLTSWLRASLMACEGSAPAAWPLNRSKRC